MPNFNWQQLRTLAELRRNRLRWKPRTENIMTESEVGMWDVYESKVSKSSSLFADIDIKKDWKNECSKENNE